MLTKHRPAIGIAKHEQKVWKLIRSVAYGTNSSLKDSPDEIKNRYERLANDYVASDLS